MIEFIYKNFNHVLFIFLLISRLGDVISTLIATPKLKLESNILAKKLGKPFIFLTLLISLIAYYDISISIVILVPSLLVSASNFGKLWLIKNIGEDNYYEMILKLIKENGIISLIIYNTLTAIFFILIGLIIYIIYPSPTEGGYGISLGFFLYGLIIIIWGTINSINLYNKTKKIKS